MKNDDSNLSVHFLPRHAAEKELVDFGEALSNDPVGCPLDSYVLFETNP